MRAACWLPVLGALAYGILTLGATANAQAAPKRETLILLDIRRSDPIEDPDRLSKRFNERLSKALTQRLEVYWKVDLFQLDTKRLTCGLLCVAEIKEMIGPLDYQYLLGGTISSLDPEGIEDKPRSFNVQLWLYMPDRSAGADRAYKFRWDRVCLSCTDADLREMVVLMAVRFIKLRPALTEIKSSPY